MLKIYVRKVKESGLRPVWASVKGNYKQSPIGIWRAICPRCGKRAQYWDFEAVLGWTIVHVSRWHRKEVA